MTTAPEGNGTDEAPVDLDNAPLRRLLTLIQPYVWVTGVITTGVAVYALRHTHPSWLAGTAIAATTAAILAAAIDYSTRRLPDALTYPIAVAGLLAFAALQISDLHTGLVRAVLGGLLYGGGMLIIALLQPRSFALGDIKLVAGLGIWAAGLTGWIGLYLTVLLGLTLLVLTGRLAKLRNGSTAFCAGPSLVGGFVIALLLA